MARRSYQRGSVKARKGKWVIRWRERVPVAKGKFGWKHRAETLGSTRGMTKGEAQVVLRERLAELDPLGQFPMRETTFEELVKRWEEESLPNRSLSTQDGNRKVVRKHLRPFFGFYRLRDLNPALVQRFVQGKVKAGLSSQTVRNVYATFRAILNFGRRLHYLKENPADGVELPAKRGMKVRSVLRPEGVMAIAQAFQGRSDRSSLALLLCSYLTGLRRGELSGLKWKDVDFEKGKIRPQQAVWNGKECGLKSKASYQPVPLAPRLGELLLDLRFHSKYADPDDFVFAARNGKPLNLANWTRRKLKPLLRELGLPDGTLQSLRHSHSTQLNALGVDPKTLQSQLRHADAEITLSRYTHQLPEAQRGAVTRLEEQLYAAGKGYLCSDVRN